MCIHPDLYCNHHPDCDDAEDEKYEDCRDKYVEKFIVKEFATLRCPSKVYPIMETLATVCDDIVECHNGEDEPTFCKHNDANIFLAISVLSILSIYFGLKSYFRIIKNKQRNIRQIQHEEMLNTRKTNESDITALRHNINCLGLHIRNYFDKKAKVKAGMKMFTLEEKQNTNEALVFQSLHNNYFPEVANMVIDAKFPGFVDKNLGFLYTISDYINRFEIFHTARLLIVNSLAIVAQYSDIFKDIYILLILIKINGGLTTLYDFPWKFSSMTVSYTHLTLPTILLV